MWRIEDQILLKDQMGGPVSEVFFEAYMTNYFLADPQ